MQTWLHVMSGVIPEVAGKDVVPAMHDVVRSLEVIVGIETRVM
jgi:hypothetical protein